MALSRDTVTFDGTRMNSYADLICLLLFLVAVLRAAVCSYRSARLSWHGRRSLSRINFPPVFSLRYCAFLLNVLRPHQRCHVLRASRVFEK